MAEHTGARAQAGWTVYSLAPDVCNTPLGSAMVPVPYAISSALEPASGVVHTVRFNGHPGFVFDQSRAPHSVGDASGSGKGLKSGTVGAGCEPIGKSSSVRVGGKPLVRQGDRFWMNERNTVGVLQAPVLTGADAAEAARAEPAAEDISAVDALQMLLDVVGLIPGVGAPADLLNAVLSALRGDWAGAALSVVGVVPVVGEAATAGKITKNSERYAAAMGKLADDVLPHLPAAARDRLQRAVDAARRKIDELGGKKHAVLPRPAAPKAGNKGRDGAKVHGRPRTRVKCFCVQDRAKGGREEYGRQLKKQQDGINGMSADDYLAQRRGFTGKDPCGGYAQTGVGKTKRRSGQVTRDAKGRRLAQQGRSYSEEFGNKGHDFETADRLGTAKAKRELGQQDALHNQDLVAGGQDAIGAMNASGQRVAGDADFGFSDTNRHIGSQWNGERIKSIDAEACRMSKDGKGDEKMNTELRPCGKHEAKGAGCKQKGRKR